MDENVSSVSSSPSVSSGPYINNRFTNINKLLRDDETNLIIKLFGWNEVPYAEMWGWTNAIPIGFPTLKNNLVLKTLSSLPHYKELLEGYATTLNVLSNYAPCKEYSPINVPVVVQVVAKKKVDAIIMEKEGKPPQLLLIGNLLVADQTGVCLCTMFNEAVEIVHERLQIGDTLVIRDGEFRPMEKSEMKFLHRFYEHLLNVEIKMGKYSVRQNQIVKLDLPALKKFPDFLFASSTERIWTPSDLQDAFGNVITPVNSAKTALEDSQKLSEIDVEKRGEKEHYLDILGVVSYVGRVERMHMKSGMVTCLLDPVKGADGHKETIKGTLALQNVTQFVAYRWIQLVDCCRKPIFLKMYIKKEWMSLQSKVVPGVVILLTNCFVAEINSYENILSDSVYTSMFINKEVRGYLKLLPDRCWKDPKIHELITPDKYAKLVTSEDVQWTAGGTHRPTIKNNQQFIQELYEAKAQSETESLIGTQSTKRQSQVKKKAEEVKFTDLVRRQAFTSTFRGKILRVTKIYEKNSKFHFLDEKGFKRYFYTDSNDALFIENEEVDITWPYYRNHCMCQGRQGVNCEQLKWFTFKRHLPPIINLPAEGNTMKEIFEQVLKQREDLCSSLLMPSSIPPMPKSALPHLARCKLVEKMPYYLVKLKDEDNSCYYEALLTNSNLKDITQKLFEARGKRIIAIVHCHKLYSGPYNKYDGCEVILTDFLIDSIITLH